MGRKRPKGKCRICGEYKKLSFEHVPPGATFNKQSVKFVSLQNWIDANDKNILPWELDKVRGTISQRGKGDYYICEDCNNKTGSWYGDHYKKFVNSIMYIYQSNTVEKYSAAVLELREMRPLAIFKQIITMFCDINVGLAESDNLKDYILDKTCMDFDRRKYRVFMYMLRGGMERLAGMSAKLDLGTGSSVMLSEISSIPVGFLLYTDLDDGYIPMATEITNFSNYEYDDEATIRLPLNIYENNTWLPGDFRGKEEIMAAIEKSRG